MVVMRNLSLAVVTGMTGPGATSEMAGQGVEVMIAGDKTRLLLNAETSGMTVHHDVMMGLVDRVVTGDDRWSRDERPPQGGRDGYREDRDREITVKVVMTKEAAGNAVVVMMREEGGQEVQTQDVMEVGLAEETTS